MRYLSVSRQQSVTTQQNPDLQIFLTQLQLDNTQNPSNARDPLGSRQIAIMETQVSSGPFHYERRGIWRRRGSKGIMGRGGMQVDIPEGKHRVGHGVRIERKSRDDRNTGEGCGGGGGGR